MPLSMKYSLNSHIARDYLENIHHHIYRGFFLLKPASTVVVLAMSIIEYPGLK